MVGTRTPLPTTATAQDRLLAAFGRRTVRDTAAVVGAFGAAFNTRDLDAIKAWTTADCVFEATAPPDGRRYEGQADVRAAWQRLFADSAEATFTEEAAYACGDRAVVQWRYDWQGSAPGHVRGVDLFLARDGLIAEKVSYVKG